MSKIRNIKEGEKINAKANGGVSTKIDFDLRSPGLVVILLVVLAVFAVVFCMYQIARANSHQKKLPTETALMRTISKNISTEGYVLRAETVLPYAGDGTVVPQVDNGSKVAVGDVVAKAYGSQTAAQNSIRYAALAEELQYYTDLSSFEADAVSVGMELYNQNILRQLFRMEEIMDRNELKALSEASRALGTDVTKKQIAVGKPVDLEKEMAQLNAQMSGLSSGLDQCMEIKAEAAGVYMNETDGYEAVGGYDGVMDITPEGVSQLINAKPAAVHAGIGKLITQFSWYLVCRLPAEEAAALEVGDTVKVNFAEYTGEEIEMKVRAVNGGTGDDLAVILSSNLMNRDVAQLRVEDVKIRTEEYTGFAVNKDALREVDGETGVYIQLGNIIRFRKVEVVYSDESVVLAANKEENGYLRLYDEIIVEGKDLSDGAIVS